MIWLFLIVTALALVLVKLGSLTVWVSVLSLALKGMLIAVATVVAALLGIKLYGVIKNKRYIGSIDAEVLRD